MSWTECRIMSIEGSPEPGNDANPEPGNDATPDATLEPGNDATPDATPEPGHDATPEPGNGSTPDAVRPAAVGADDVRSVQAPQPPPRRRWLPLLVAGAVLLVVTLGVAVFGALRDDPGQEQPGAAPGGRPGSSPGRDGDAVPGGPADASTTPKPGAAPPGTGPTPSGPTPSGPTPSGPAPSGSAPNGSAPTGPAGAAAGNHVVSARLDARTEAALDIVSSASALTLRAGDLGDDLYRVETPMNGALLPRADDNAGRITVRLEPAGVQGPGSVTMMISSKVTWRIKLAGSVAEQTVDVSGGRISALEVAGGSGKVDVTLPRPSGTLPLTMSGGVGQLLIHVPRGFPVQTRLGNGAGTVTVDGAARSNVTPGTVITPPGWGAAGDRYDVNATAGLSTLTVDRR